MRRARSAAVLLGIVLAFAGSPAFGQQPRADRPRYAVGERWIRSDGAYELVRINNGEYIFVAEGEREINMSADGWITLLRHGHDTQWTMSLPPALPWPLQVGQSGRGQGGWWTAEHGGGNATFEWSVDGYEDVKVAAGTFKAFRVKLTITREVTVYAPQVRGQYSPPERRTLSWTIRSWYAPEVRQWIKASGRNIGRFPFEVVAIEKPTVAPLRVALREPGDQTTVHETGLKLGGRVTSGSGVRRVIVALNNGEVFAADERSAPRPAVDLDVPLSLRPGKNVLTVTASDTAGDTRQEARVVFLQPRTAAAAPPGLVGEPAPAPAEPPKPATTVDAPPRPVPTTPSPPQVTSPPVPARPAPETPKPEPRIALAAPPQSSPPPPPTPPLRVALSSPLNQARLGHETVGLAGLVSGGKGVTRVAVTLNGVEVSRRDERTPQRAVAGNLPLRLREGQNTLVVTASDTDGVLEQEVRTVLYEKVVPLGIAVSYPQEQARVTDETSIVAAAISSSRGVASVRVTLNGTEVSRQSERASPKSLVVTAPLKLREGANVVVISAEEPDGHIRQELRTIFFDKPKAAAPPPLPPPAPAKPAPERWAVVIGVGEYESATVPRLRYAVPDAEAIYEALVGSAGFKRERVLLLTDKTERKPTLRNVKWALGTFLARSARKDDTVLIFYAGHGAPEIDQRGVERDGLAKYLVPSDADPDDLYSTALPMDELTTIFGRIESERIVAFLDSCYSGAAGGRTFTSKKTRSGQVDDLFLERVTRAKGRAIVTASRPAEVSLELAELGHGIFTYYLVQGLKGAGDLNRDGIVALQELYEYVEQQVSRKSRSVGGNQHPVMKGELEGVLPLVKLSEAAR